MRLEGWATGAVLVPPFETRSCGPLLRVRSVLTLNDLDADLSRARRHDLVDKLAAAHILQGAIDALMTARL